MSTTENNKLIAEFMGVDLNTWRFEESEGKSVPLKAEHLRYHESWDWLMPVVEKIESEFTYVNICRFNTQINALDQNGKMLFSTEIRLNRDGISKLDITYAAVIDFINWYNQNK